MSEAFIAVVDLETTGLDAPEHVPIEIGWARLRTEPDLLGGDDWSRAIVMPRVVAAFVAPGRAVPPESSAIHHLVEADLAGAPNWQQTAEWFRIACGDAAAYAAHSARFERQWLTPERVGPAPWICTYKCALRAWPEAPGHGNQVLRYWLRPGGLVRETAALAHRAGPDAYVTAFLLRELLREHPLETLLAWSEEPAVLIRVPFGRRPEEGGNRGRKWTEVDDGFLAWTVCREFGEDILHTVRREIARRDALDKAQAGDDGLRPESAGGEAW